MSSKHLILSVILTLTVGPAWAQDEPEDDEATTELGGYSVQSDMRSGFESDEDKIKLEKPDFSRDFKMDSVRPSMSGMNVENSRPKLKVLGPPPEQPAAAAGQKQASNEGNEGNEGSNAGAAAQQPVARQSGQTTEIRPLQMNPPNYPSQAMRRRQEGSVTLEFTVTTDGSTDNINVVSANPPRVFDREAIRAVSRWKFEPAKVNGTPQAQRIRHTIEFTLN